MAQIETLSQLTALIPDPGPVASAKLLNHLDDQARAFIARSPFLIMGTEGEAGVDLSPKGDDPGFVHIVDPQTLLVPERTGNQLKIGLRNILADGRVGLLFIRPGTGDVLRVVGRAALFDDADLCEQLTSHGKPAIMALKVAVEQAFFHCPRAIFRAQLWSPASWDAPSPVSMGRIIGRALGRPEITDVIDGISDERNRELWL